MLHLGVKCDRCGQSPIRGSRFMCTKRQDFDLCGTCEEEEGREAGEEEEEGKEGRSIR